MTTKHVTVAIDVGASKIAGALIGEGFELLHEIVESARHNLDGTIDPELKQTKEVISKLLKIAENENYLVDSGGACFAEYVMPNQRLNSKDQIAWKIQPKDDFKSLTGFNWTIESDVRAMALAEIHLSSIDPNFLFITISSGISHALVISGEPWSGHTGEAIGFGIIQIDNSIESPTLEEYSSGLGIARRYQKVARAQIESAEIVFERFNEDPVAKEIIESAASVLGKAIASLVEILDPSQIVIGGGLWLGSHKYRELVMVSYLSNSSKRRPAPPIKNSVAGASAAVIGAAIAAN
jgi:glucokinase